MRRPAHLSLCVLLLLLCSTSIRAQEQRCTTTLGQLPELGSLSLGMTEGQVRARFRVVEEEPADDYGVAGLRLEPAASTGAQASSTVRDIFIELIKGRIVSIRLVYMASANNLDYGEFTTRVSQSLKLPPAWKAVALGSMVTEMTMDCAGFRISARLIGAKIPVVSLSALEAEQTLSRRQAEKERRLREFFKQ